MRIITTTDNKFIGTLIDINESPINLCDGTYFFWDMCQELDFGRKRISNSNYVIEVEEE